ncbi:MAG TPA: malto-oligosyltrehalose trehalohydrolase [Longimicrobiales bacterium]|nr:malto-oligosyltrehalose trehalohydrolase [Longimicrobiales bacterium]
MGGTLGARPLDDGRCAFRVWAPAPESVAVALPEDGRVAALAPTERGYHEGVVDDVAPGTHYLLVLDGDLERPDPASRFQPEGVHGPSAVVARDFPWTDGDWRGLRLGDLVFYELHVGTFSPEGTFDGVIPHLRRLREELGVTSIEIMPVAQFPGTRNWGYDGVLPYAVQDSYGGPDGLRRLVDAAHGAGLAVTLDVVYNHLGPEGNHLRDFGPYFTSSYATPWGDALNFDDTHSDEVRRYFVDNALHWFEEYHVDALRLDAVHAIIDRSARHLLAQLADETAELASRLGRPLHLIAESDLNDARLIHRREDGGYGLDAQWADDFHHAVHARLTGEREGYYADYGSLEPLARALRVGWAFTGEYSGFRQRSHGNDPGAVPPERFVVAVQNHDQVGNRMLGERLGRVVVDFEALKVAAAANLLSPFLPLLFMGEEYAETAPFPYFVSHTDDALVQAVREGRRDEFASFAWAGEPPDPQAESTFASARLDHALREQGRHAQVYALYRELLRTRAAMPELRGEREVEVVGPVVVLRRKASGAESVLLLALAEAGAEGHAQAQAQAQAHAHAQASEIRIDGGPWTRALDTAEERWGGPGTRIGPRIGAGERVRLNAWQAILLRTG